jgi:hypothetical protein
MMSPGDDTPHWLNLGGGLVSGPQGNELPGDGELDELDELDDDEWEDFEDDDEDDDDEIEAWEDEDIEDEEAGLL